MSEKQIQILQRLFLPTHGNTALNLVKAAFNVLIPELQELLKTDVRAVYDRVFPKIKDEVWRYPCHNVVKFLHTITAEKKDSEYYQSVVSMKGKTFPLQDYQVLDLKNKPLGNGIPGNFQYFQIRHELGLEGMIQVFYEKKASLAYVVSQLQKLGGKDGQIANIEALKDFVEKYIEVLEGYKLLFEGAHASAGSAGGDGGTTGGSQWQQFADTTTALAAKALTGLSVAGTRAFTNIQTKVPAQLQAFHDGSMTSARANALWAMWKNYQLYLYNDELAAWAKRYVDLMYDWLVAQVGAGSIDTSKVKATPVDLQHACEKLNELRDDYRSTWERLNMPEATPGDHQKVWADVKNILMSNLPTWFDGIKNCTMTMKEAQTHYQNIQQLLERKVERYFDRAPYTDLDGDGNSIFKKMQPVIYFLKQQIMPLFLAYYHMLNGNAYVLPPLVMYADPTPGPAPGGVPAGDATGGSTGAAVDPKTTELLVDLSQTLRMIAG